MRKAGIDRKTAETDISLTLDLDGSGLSDIQSGLGFLDHMLTLFAKHGRFDLTLKCAGDTRVDGHHTTEDIGICLGRAFREALGDKKGIVRYGEGTFDYSLSILKSNGTPDVCRRFCFDYEPEAGVGHFIHTYRCDGSPIPSFKGEPEEVALPNTAEELARLVWDNLNADNKVSLFVRAVPLAGGRPTDIIINKNI